METHIVKNVWKKNMNIRNQIKKLIDKLGKDFQILKYVYGNQSSFVAGKTPVFYSGMYWDEEEIVSAIESLLVGKWISSGENVKLFETEFAKAIGEKYGVMVNSGSSANLIMIASLKKYFGWEDNDEIIVSVVGFPTTTSAIIQNNLKPIFSDIEMKTLNFDLNIVENLITNKTKGIFVSPVLGNPPDFDRLIKICEKNNLALILDDCDSLGSCWRGQTLNKKCVASSHSFYAAHTISTGEGGMITTNNPSIAKIARSMINWGRGCFCYGEENLIPEGICGKRFNKWLKNYDGIVDHKYVFETMGYNLKPLDLQGAIGLVQLKKLPEIYEKRYSSKNKIEKIFLKNIPDISTPEVLDWATPVWFGTPIICKNKEQKDRLVFYLEKNKIQTRNYFAGNLLLHPAYEYLDNFSKYKVANLVLDLVFFVGASPHYDKKVFKYFKKVLKDFKNE